MSGSGIGRGEITPSRFCGQLSRSQTYNPRGKAMDTKYHVVWEQREDAIAFAHLEGGQTTWKKSNKRAAKFTWKQAGRFISQFANGRTLLQVLEA